jgi:hypothetical protein
MSAEIPSFHRDDKPADMAAALRREGALIVREVLSPEAVDSLKRRLEPAFDRVKMDPESLMGSKKSLDAPFTRGREFSEQLLLNPVLLDMADAILLPQAPMGPSKLTEGLPEATSSDSFEEIYDRLWQPRDPIRGPNCHHYRMNASAATQVYAGRSTQPLHREMDTFRPFIEQSADEPECILASNWALSDFTADNGATLLVPGSHLWPEDREAEEHELAQAVMPKGSVVFWSGRLLHSFGVNRSDEPREALLFTLIVNWLTTEENQYFAVPPEIAKDLPHRAQQLLGYRASPLLGWARGRNADNMLEPGASSPLDLVS